MGAGTLRADSERAAGIQTNDRTTARTDTHYVDGRAAHRKLADERFVALEDTAGTERHVCRCTTHV